YTTLFRSVHCASSVTSSARQSWGLSAGKRDARSVAITWAPALARRSHTDWPILPLAPVTRATAPSRPVAMLPLPFSLGFSDGGLVPQGRRADAQILPDRLQFGVG